MTNSPATITTSILHRELATLVSPTASAGRIAKAANLLLESRVLLNLLSKPIHEAYGMRLSDYVEYHLTNAPQDFGWRYYINAMAYVLMETEYDLQDPRPAYDRPIYVPPLVAPVPNTTRAPILSHD